MLKKTFTWLKLIPQLWWKTLTDLSVYHSVLRFPRWFGFVYLTVTYFLLALAATAVFAGRTLPQWEQAAVASWQQLQNQWPENQVVAWQNDQLSIQPDSPFTVPYPDAIELPAGMPEHLAMVDVTQSEPPADDTALITVGSLGLLFSGSTAPDERFWTWNELLTADQLPREPITKSALQSYDVSVRQAIRASLWALLSLVFLLSWIGVLMLRLLLLVLYSWFAQTLFWMFGRRIKYAAVFRIGLFALPVAELIPLAWKALYGSVPITGAFWWIWLAFMAIVAWYMRRKAPKKTQ